MRAHEEGARLAVSLAAWQRLIHPLTDEDTKAQGWGMTRPGTQGW